MLEPLTFDQVQERIRELAQEKDALTITLGAILLTKRISPDVLGLLVEEYLPGFTEGLSGEPVGTVVTCVITEQNRAETGR